MNVFPLVSYPGCLLWGKSGFICEWRLQQAILVPKCLLASRSAAAGSAEGSSELPLAVLQDQIFSFLAIWPMWWWQSFWRACSAFRAALFWMRAGSQIPQFWRRDWPFMRATVHLSVLSAATSASLYLTELFQSQPLLLWHQVRRPLSLWRDFPPDTTWLCHFSAEYSLWTSLNWSSRSSWFPPVCINGTNTWRIMNGFCKQDSPRFYSKSTKGAIHLCHSGGTGRKPWAAPGVSNCSYSHPLGMSRGKLSPVNREMNPFQTSTFLS